MCIVPLNYVICGVDEAGKGSVLGPLVIAAVCGESYEIFKNRGYADSKRLSKSKRDELFTDICESFNVSIITLSASEIDEMRKETGMNSIIAAAHADAILALKPARAYVDACDVNALRYGKTVADNLSFSCEIISEHKADSLHPVVSAASIIAKVTRDRMICDLYDEYGDFGSGYPSDSKTIDFLDAYIRSNGNPPACARKSWKTVQTITERVHQSTLSDF